jgi:uncharacterized membrane protein
MLLSSVPHTQHLPGGACWQAAERCDQSDERRQAAACLRDIVGIRQAGERRRVVLFRGAETHARSVLKAVSWRTLGTLDTFVISWFLTGKLELAGLIAGLEFITKIAWYYLHERVWAAISWGLR